MFAAIRNRLTYANVMATLAVFVALGGTSFAAATLITGKNVKDSSLTGADVRTGGLTGSDVKDKSLSPADFSGSVAGPAGARGITGTSGEAGAQGAKGEPGGPGAKGDTGAQGAAGTPAIVARSVIPVTGTRSGDAPFYLFSALGSFVKTAANSRIQLTYVTDYTGSFGCRIQLRVDGVNANGSSLPDSNTQSTPGDLRAAGSGIKGPAIVLASFGGLSAGTHAVSLAIAAQDTASICTDNALGTPRQVIVEEMAI
jgi:Collagen triple helix repeat (20 copies)